MRHLAMAEVMIRSMITDYLGFDKKRAQDTRTVKHGTPQEKGKNGNYTSGTRITTKTDASTSHGK
jgi:hypothetical protein